MDHAVFRGFYSTICGGDEEGQEAQCTLFEWMKGMIVTPEFKPDKAIALIGTAGGEGKDTVIEVLRRMLGNGAALETTEPQRDVWGRANSLMEDALVVHITEYNIDETALAHVQVLLTDPRIRVRELHGGARDIPSFHRVIITTNFAIPNGPHRRIEQIRCYPPTGDKAAHFNAFYAMLEQATPDDLRHAVVSYAAYLKARARWKALRAYCRARWIGVFWHALTAKHMAPGGTTAKRDRAAYEAD